MTAGKPLVDQVAEGGPTTMFEVTARVKIRDGQLDGFKRQTTLILATLLSGVTALASQGLAQEPV